MHIVLHAQRHHRGMYTNPICVCMDTPGQFNVNVLFRVHLISHFFALVCFFWNVKCRKSSTSVYFRNHRHHLFLQMQLLSSFRASSDTHVFAYHRSPWAAMEELSMRLQSVGNVYEITDSVCTSTCTFFLRFLTLYAWHAYHDSTKYICLEIGLEMGASQKYFHLDGIRTKIEIFVKNNHWMVGKPGEISE